MRVYYADGLAFALLSTAPWTAAIPSSRHDRLLLPQCIAHRGYKAAYAENSMAAFRAAVRVGAHALETDIRLSADGVAVISHVRVCFPFFIPLTDGFLSLGRTAR